MKADVKDFEQSLKRLNSTEQDKNFRRRTWWVSYIYLIEQNLKCPLFAL